MRLKFAATLLLNFLILSSSHSIVPNAIPEFIPNVVDLSHHLPKNEIEEINQNFELLRDKADIWGAVYIVQSLNEEPIENLAERTFKKWELGQSGKDNGLLLIIALKDRKARFEVGYGLEGDLPDILTSQAQIEKLVPNMKLGQTKNAIIEAFNYLAYAKTQDAIFTETAGDKDAAPSTEYVNEPVDARRGLISWVHYLLCFFLTLTLTRIRFLRLATKLSEAYPKYDVSKNLDFVPKLHIGLKLLFSVNPGLFVFVGSALSIECFYIFLILFTIIAFLYFILKPKRFRSLEAYMAYLNKVRASMKEDIEKGYIKETTDGVFEFTELYYDSPEYKVSRSRSSSRSSRSSSSRGSSSGGGRSGGGGSNSSW